MRVVSKYEVACPACGVSYPPGQKRCVHCGGRTTKSVVEMPDAPPEFTDAIGTPEPEPAAMAGPGREIIFLPDDTMQEEEQQRRGGWLARLGGLTWLILFIVITAIRACSEGSD